jgi:hypothetical protein
MFIKPESTLLPARALANNLNVTGFYDIYPRIGVSLLLVVSFLKTHKLVVKLNPSPAKKKL